MLVIFEYSTLISSLENIFAGISRRASNRGIVIFEHEGWRIGWKEVRSKIRLHPRGGWYRTILISRR